MITDAAPALRPDIVLGAPMRLGPSVVHYIKDPLTGGYYRLGAREFFLVTRLDGQRSRDEIDADYAARFGRRLTAVHWDSLLSMLYRRRLIAGPDAGPDADAVAVPPAPAGREQPRASRRRLLLARFPLVNPDPFLRRVVPRLGVLYSPWFVLPALLLALTAGFLALTDLGALYAASRSNIRTPLFGVSFGVTWLVIALHEMAHGLTCRRYGGTVREIGLMWRFPMVVPYCKTDDIVVFSRRRHRVYTAFAGVFVNLISLIPFCVAWVLLPPGTQLHALAGSLLFYGLTAVGLNLLPVFRSDGYFMLTHAIGLADLRAETYRFWAALVRRVGTAGYTRSDRVAYGTYGVLVFGSLVAIIAGIVAFWFWSLDRLIGPFGAAAVLGAEAVLLAFVVRHLIRRRRRMRAAGESAGASAWWAR